MDNNNEESPYVWHQSYGLGMTVETKQSQCLVQFINDQIWCDFGTLEVLPISER